MRDTNNPEAMGSMPALMWRSGGILTEHDRAYRNGVENIWEIVFAIKDGGTEEGNVI